MPSPMIAMRCFAIGLLQRADRTTQLGETFQAPDAGVAGIDPRLLDIVEHTVAMVRPERDTPGLLALAVLGEQYAQHVDHAHVAVEMIGFGEADAVAVVVDARRAQ